MSLPVALDTNVLVRLLVNDVRADQAGLTPRTSASSARRRS